MIRVAIVDDHPIFRDGVVHALGLPGDIEIVGIGATATDATAICRDVMPDVVILDMDMPGGGILAIEAIRSEAPTVHILMLTVVSNEEKVCEALRKGVRGYVLKGVGGTELVQAIRIVSAGECYVAPTLTMQLMAHVGKPAITVDVPEPLAKLSARENQIISLIAQGHSNKEIGRELNLSDKTVKHYVTGLLQKLGVRNRVEAALMAVRPSAFPVGRTGYLPDQDLMLDP